MRVIVRWVGLEFSKEQEEFEGKIIETLRAFGEFPEEKELRNEVYAGRINGEETRLASVYNGDKSIMMMIEEDIPAYIKVEKRNERNSVTSSIHEGLSHTSCFTNYKFLSVNGSIEIFLSLETPDPLKVCVHQGIVLLQVIPQPTTIHVWVRGHPATDSPSPVAGGILVRVLHARLITAIT